jgi:dTDP-4-dehydrorhamnose reductase
MRILITGAAGMLGRDAARAAAEAGHEPLALARSDLDIRDREAVSARVAAERPDVVLNCAAWTDVDGAEAAEPDALAVNAAGAGNLAAAAAAAGAWTIHISTDYVFDGSRGGSRRPYVESDAVAPINAYGRTKLAGEREVAGAAPRAHTIVRSSWLFGAGGRCFPQRIMRLAREREQLRVVADQIGCPTFTGHLARTLVALAERRRPPAGIVHVAGAGQCSWFQFAQEIVARVGIACEVEPCATAELPPYAPRPAWSVLGSERAAELPRLPDWHAGLGDYLAAVAVHCT